MDRSDLNQSYAAFDQASTIVGVVELSLKSWVVSGLVPGVRRQPLKRLPALSGYARRLLSRRQSVGPDHMGALR